MLRLAHWVMCFVRWLGRLAWISIQTTASAFRARPGDKFAGGTKLLDSQRPEKIRGVDAVGVALLPVAGTWALIQTHAPGVLDSAPDRTGTFGLIVMLSLTSLFLTLLFIRQRGGNSGGLQFFKFYWHALTRLSWLAVSCALGLATLIAWLLASAIPSADFLVDVGAVSYIASSLVGGAAAIGTGHTFVQMRTEQYRLMQMWGNPDDGILKKAVGKAITTPEMHKAVHFESDCVRIFPASPDIAERFSGIELAMARGHIDQWMVDEDSTPTDIRFVPITDEQLLRRQTLRASNYTLLGFDDREIDDEEILKRSITIDPALVIPAATIPPKPRAAQAAEHVTEKDLPLIQRFAAEQGMTVVGYDLHRWNPAKERFEKLIYVQTVTQEEAEIIQLISNRLLAGKSWEMWAEFHWVDNEEDDQDEHPKRFDSVIFKTSPVRGMDSERRLAQWALLIEMLPKGSNGTIREDDQATEFATLKYGKRLTLPDVFRSRDTLPKRHESMSTILEKRLWARIPVGISARGRTITVNLVSVPHLLAAGGTNSGKSTAILQDIIARRARGHMIAVFDNSAKKGGDYLQTKPHSFMWCTSPTESANGLDLIYQEVRRRSRYLMENYRVNNWLQVTDYQGLIAGGVLPTTVYFDEYETSIDYDKDPKYLAADDPKKAQIQNKNRAVDEIQGKMLKLAREARAVGVFLYVATQSPLVSAIGSAFRKQLGNSLQLAAGKMSSTDVALTMGSSTDTAMEQFKSFHRPKLDAKGREVLDENGERIMKPGLGVLLSDGSAPLALRVAFAKPEEAPQLLRELGVPEAQPWELRDELDLDMANDTDRFVDLHDSRPSIAPPFHDQARGETRALTGARLVSTEPAMSPSVAKLAELFGKDPKEAH